MRDYSKTKTFKQGITGENAVEDYFAWEDVSLLFRCPSNRAFPYDFKYLSNKTGKQFIVEVKTKIARDWFPDVSIDLKDYETYLRIIDEQQIDFYIFFVDYETKACYWFNLRNIDRLKKKYNPVRIRTHKYGYYPLKGMGDKGQPVVYFPLCWMKVVFQLDVQTIDALKELAKDSDVLRKKYCERLLMQTDFYKIGSLDDISLGGIDGLGNSPERG